MQLVIDVYVREKNSDNDKHDKFKILHETLDEFEILQVVTNKINDRTDKYLIDSINIIQINI